MAGSSESTSSGQSTSQSFIPDYSETPILEAIANQAAGMSSQVYQWGMNQFNATQGNIDSMMRDALSYASPQRISTDMGMAESGVQQGVEAARQSAITDLQSYGIDPSSGRYAALDEANRVMGAASAAGAGNQQRMADIAAGNAMRNQAISASEQNNMFGLGVGNSANSFLSTAMNLKYPPLGTQSQSSQSSQSSSQSTNPPTQPSQPKSPSQPGAGSGGKGSGGGGGTKGGGGGGGMAAPPNAPGQAPSVTGGIPEMQGDAPFNTYGLDPNSPFTTATDPQGIITGLDPSIVSNPVLGPEGMQYGIGPNGEVPAMDSGSQPANWGNPPTGYGPQEAQTPDQGPQIPDQGPEIPDQGPGLYPPTDSQGDQVQSTSFGDGGWGVMRPSENVQDLRGQDATPSSQFPQNVGNALADAGQQLFGPSTAAPGSLPDQLGFNDVSQYQPYANDPTGGAGTTALTGIDPVTGQQIDPNQTQTGGAPDSTPGGVDLAGGFTPGTTSPDFSTTAPDWSSIFGQGGTGDTGISGATTAPDFSLPPDAQGGITDPNSIWDQAAQDAGNFNTGFGGGNYIGQGGNYSGGSNYAGGSNYSGNYGGNYIGQGGNYSGDSNYAGGSNYSGNYGGNYIGQGGNYSGGSNYAGGSNYSGNYGGSDSSGGGGGGSDSSGGGGGSNYSGGGNYTGSYTGSDNTPTTDNTFDPSASDSGGAGGDYGGGGYARGGPVRMQGRRHMPMRTGFRPMLRMQAGGPMPPGRMDPPPTPPPGVRPRPLAARHRAAPGGLMPGNFISPNGMVPPATGGMPIGRPTRPPPGIQQPRRPQPPPQQGFAGGGQVADPTTGGFVSKNLSPSNGGKTDDVNAKLNAGEFVIPKDVAAWEGKKFFYNLIAKARKMRAAGQKPEQAKVGYAAGGPFQQPGGRTPAMPGAVGQPAPPRPMQQPPTRNQVARPSPLPNFQTARRQTPMGPQ